MMFLLGYVRRCAGHVDSQVQEIIRSASLSRADAGILAAMNIADQYFRLPVREQGIEGQINFCTPKMAVRNRRRRLFLGKIFGAAARPVFPGTADLGKSPPPGEGQCGGGGPAGGLYARHGPDSAGDWRGLSAGGAGCGGAAASEWARGRVLESASLYIRKGESIAFIGSSHFVKMADNR